MCKIYLSLFIANNGNPVFLAPSEIHPTTYINSTTALHLSLMCNFLLHMNRLSWIVLAIWWVECFFVFFYSSDHLVDGVDFFVCFWILVTIWWVDGVVISFVSLFLLSFFWVLVTIWWVDGVVFSSFSFLSFIFGF